MSRVGFGAELGFDIFAENGTDIQASIISGTAVPDGVSGRQGIVPIGSLYLRSGTGEIYQKVANAGNAADYELNGSGSSNVLPIFRDIVTRAATGDALAPGIVDPTTFSDNESGLDGTAFAVGEFLLGGVGGTPVLYEVTAVGGANSITIAEAVPALQDNDGLIVRVYLPDSPANQENTAGVMFQNGNIVKLFDVDFAFATGISLTGTYAAAVGDVQPGDTVQLAISKLDGVNDAQDTLLGVPQGSTDLGTFAGVTIPDNVTVKAALQALETAFEETDQNVDDLITLSGAPENSQDLGTFTGTTIPDNSTIKEALQALETSGESLATVVAEIDQNVDDLITLSGVPENSTDLGAFNGDLFADGLTVKQALQRTEDLLDELKMVEVESITTEVSVDEVPIATYPACKWFVEIEEQANNANRRAAEVYALNDGALAVDSNNTSRLRVGSNFNASLSVDISGGLMRLRASSSTAGIRVRARRVGVVDI